MTTFETCYILVKHFYSLGVIYVSNITKFLTQILNIFGRIVESSKVNIVIFQFFTKKRSVTLQKISDFKRPPDFVILLTKNSKKSKIYNSCMKNSRLLIKFCEDIDFMEHMQNFMAIEDC